MWAMDGRCTRKGTRARGVLQEVRAQKWEASVQGELEVWAEQILSLNTSVHRLEKEL